MGGEEKKMGMKGCWRGRLMLEEVEVGRENVVGDMGKGDDVGLKILKMGRLKVAFSKIGRGKEGLKVAVS